MSRLIWSPETPQVCDFAAPLVEALFLERPNRFVAFCDLAGERIRTHVPDPGRLKELLIPGVTVMLLDGGDNPKRKTRYSLALVKSPDGQHWVSLDTQLPNQVVRLLLTHNQLAPFATQRLVKPEFCWGKSRFDFLLEDSTTGRPHLLEAKSVTLVDDTTGTALFPDAPTVRGARHLDELRAAKTSGAYEASVLFVVQRPDACRVVPNAATDPVFCQAVSQAAEAGVAFHAIAYSLSPLGLILMPNALPVVTGIEALLS